MARWYPAMWVWQPEWFAFAFYKQGEREEGKLLEPDLRIDYEQARLLLPILEEQGLLKPRLDERLRTEDLKITHRLLDIIATLNTVHGGKG